jgi:Zn ribbon nucleic-acid-binding protein
MKPPPRRARDEAKKRLVICPLCASALIYPIDLAGWGEDTVVSRRCPECEHRDVVALSAVAAFLRFVRITRERKELAALCDAIADGLPVEFGLGTSRRAGG